VITHDILHKLCHIEFDEEHFEGYQISMREIARKLVNGTKENIKWQKMEWTKDVLLKHNFLICNEGSVVTVHNHIMLVYIPSTERMRKFNELSDVIENLVNDNGNLSHCVSGLASVSRGHSRLSCGKTLMAGSHCTNTKKCI
jgi:hypothetical protein